MHPIPFQNAVEPQAAEPPDPRIGMVLQERYRIVRKIGDGGMGTVYEAAHLHLYKRVAVKVLHTRFAAEPEMLARFQREAEAASAIGHPNIVEVHDLGRLPDGTPYLLLELLEGRDWVHDIRHEGAQSLGKVVHILSQVCDALGAAHAKGILHRDMKPENVFLTQRSGDPCFVKVVDFGISKMFELGEQALTETGTTLGTPYYMSPEQCSGSKDLDGRTDIYALGVILFKALTREYPFAASSYPVLIMKICTEEPPLLGDYRTDLPPQIQAILDRMLAKDPAHRFGTCAEVKAALEPFRSVTDAPALAPHPPTRAPMLVMHPAMMRRNAEPPTRSPLRSLLLLGGAGLVLLMALAFVSVMVMTAFAPQPRAASVRPVRAAVVRPVPLTPPPPPVAPQAPPTVHVHIYATPATAHMFLDGDPIPNPFEADVRRDPDPVPGQERRIHLVRVRARGYRTHEQELVFRFDNLNLPIELLPGRADNIVRVRADGSQAIQPRALAPPVRVPPPYPVQSHQRSAIFGPGAQPSSGGNQTVSRGAVFGGQP